MTYRFTNCDGDELLKDFDNLDEARQFAYVFGLCFIGRI